MQLSDFDYYLPPELIAQTPLEQRALSRLLVLKRQNAKISHHSFSELPDFLTPDDLLVLNNTKVLPARLLGNKAGSGGKAEVLLLRPYQAECWEALVKPARRLKPGAVIEFAADFKARIVERTPEGTRILSFEPKENFWLKLEKYGRLPLPPYIKKPLLKPDRYQTVYADLPGAVAAPTAGLHFTREILEKIRQKGIPLLFLTLHIGLGTFRLVKSEDITRHRMEAEYYLIPEETAAGLNRAIAAGKRIVAVGTTVVRALESSAGEGSGIKAGPGRTSLFIYPGFKFRVVKALLTNFHLPRSTLLFLVSAFAGREAVLTAYRAAIREKYRFYSFGDAMLIAD